VSYGVVYSGEITQAEFFFLINEERCALTKGIFDLAGIKYDQKYIRFDEYLICVCRFAALTKPQLYEFLFQLFDIDQSGSLNENEFQLMSQELQSKQFHFSVRVMTAMKKLGKMDSNQSSKILDLKNFMRLVKSFPVAFYRIINLQNNVRARTLGEKYWSLLSGRKLKVDALLVQMRRNNGSLRPLTCQEKFWGMFDEEIYAIRKRVSEIYARELIERKDLLP
jgi:hypothetical protein